MMNKHDRDNLMFLINADKATMKKWYRTVSKDDVDYALELLHQYKSELMVKEMEYMDDVDDVGMAREALKKFM
jgi:hypothetical protein